MSFEELIALQPQWVQIWLNVLLVGAFVLPLALLIWKESRIAAVITVVASGLAGFGVMQMFERMGYVKLLGLPHVIIWTPLAWYLYRQITHKAMPQWPKRIMIVVLATILISLAFDYVDVVRSILGERTPFTG